MIQENLKVLGNLVIIKKDESGNIVDERKIKNLVVDAGKNYIANRLTANTAVVLSHMAVGSGNVAPGSANTALISELGRVSLTSSTLNDNVITYLAEFGAGTATGTIAEAGIFNDSSSGTMLCRTQFNEINKGASDTIVITWNVSIE